VALNRQSTVEGCVNVAEAIADAEDDELPVIDAPAGGNRGTFAIAAAVTLVVRPSGGSVDDLRPAILHFQELASVGIPKERLGARRGNPTR
jgi:chromosome partitioning protein